MTRQVGVLGTGNIARDLFEKIHKAKGLRLGAVFTRNSDTAGARDARDRGAQIFTGDFSRFLENTRDLELVFDATSAAAHQDFSVALRKRGLPCVDLTPSGAGKPIVPALNLTEAVGEADVNMVSCGGQIAIPLATEAIRLLRNFTQVDYVEAVSTIASQSAGPATRLNIDNYVEHTSTALQLFSSTPSKIVLIINPADPPIAMNTSVSIRLGQVNENALKQVRLKIEDVVARISRYASGYSLETSPVLLANNRLFASVKYVGSGDFLPKYAGNLDIINQAAIVTALTMLGLQN